MVGNTTVFVKRVIGLKKNGEKNYIVVDGSFKELIRSDAKTNHDIEVAGPVKTKPKENFKKYDIIGPTKTSDLGKDRVLQEPKLGDSLVVFDVGAQY